MDVGKIVSALFWLLLGAIIFPAFLITALFYPIWEEWGKGL